MASRVVVSETGAVIMKLDPRTVSGGGCGRVAFSARKGFKAGVENGDRSSQIVFTTTLDDTTFSASQN